MQALRMKSYHNISSNLSIYLFIEEILIRYTYIIIIGHNYKKGFNLTIINYRLRNHRKRP